MTIANSDGCGSSPRVRGTRFRVRSSSRAYRFIPARAGNAHSARRPRQASAVHPRACGERDADDLRLDRMPGSSPRVRGTRLRCVGHGLLRRFIPARAGNAFASSCAIAAISVHPRACGERLVWICRPVYCGGSSPRVRGTRILGQIRPFRGRFIPARAGNAACKRSTCSTCSVHPRACGERSKTSLRSARRFGSSPRVRGTLLRDDTEFLTISNSASRHRHGGSFRCRPEVEKPQGGIRRNRRGSDGFCRRSRR